VLDGLVQGALEDQKQREKTLPLAALKEMAASAPAVRPFGFDSIPAGGVGVIAEVKRASPSKGLLANIPDPVALALDYEAGGAVAVSVLTEGRQFLGSLEDLQAVSRAVGIPVLRKDFMTTDYHIWEARAYGADMVLLIMACLDDAQASRLHHLATSLGMAVLVEAHTADETERAVSLGATIIGVNARDLATFELDRDLFGRLAPGIPANVLKVAESAVAKAADVHHYREGGADCVLVGEALVTGGSPRDRVKEFSRP
jgi:indole-3-glycerol phosphate synthase